MYDKAAVIALGEVRGVIERLGPAILYRKLYGVLNAIEMQVEDGGYRLEAVRHLGDALREIAVFYKVNSDVQLQLSQEFMVFMSKLKQA